MGIEKQRQSITHNRGPENPGSFSARRCKSIAIDSESMIREITIPVGSRANFGKTRCDARLGSHAETVMTCSSRRIRVATPSTVTYS